MAGAAPLVPSAYQLPPASRLATFLRRFAKATGMRPVEYLQQVRIARAREALELTRDPVDAIAWSVGYADPAAFRKLFQRLTGETPMAYRRRFGVA